MAIKKSDLYSSLWASCDELRGGMDASQYKDYVLFMLFIKYVSDKYADYEGAVAPIEIPKGASFKDMAALKGKLGKVSSSRTTPSQPRPTCHFIPDTLCRHFVPPSYKRRRALGFSAPHSRANY